MTKLKELEEELVELKLKKRDLLLAGKDTEKIDQMIKEVEKSIKEEKQA
ncbi:hypothetical protein CPJCM30710_31770 [Clostridium polyendosporum]|uniref:Uncharacterized protein n=1 Tax=Clostridium polyendosporum TaxID=69208 RepID=A0A919VI91_9CLOT|nr:hypothetical protein [Clostridium polyendosporum]GIM30511.1 hypothetical protein CPJCM30710_31770 [Clostridium polyendosporum]